VAWTWASVLDQGGKSLHQIYKKRKSNWTGQRLGRNCLLKQVIEGNIERRMEGKGRRGRRSKQPQGDFKEKNK